MKHEAELAKLPGWAQPIIAALLDTPPRDVARALDIKVHRIDYTKHVARRLLGQGSPLMAAITRKCGRPSGSIHGRYEPSHVALLTTPGPDGHVHVARFDDDGNGRTTLVAGHLHRVAELELVEVGGHRHDLTDRRV